MAAAFPLIILSLEGQVIHTPTPQKFYGTPSIKVWLPHNRQFTLHHLNPLKDSWVANNRSCEDALLVTINEVTSHLHSKISAEKNKVSGIITKSRNSVRIMLAFFPQLSTPFCWPCWPTNIIYAGPKLHDTMDNRLFNLPITNWCFSIFEIWHSLLEY